MMQDVLVPPEHPIDRRELPAVQACNLSRVHVGEHFVVLLYAKTLAQVQVVEFRHQIRISCVTRSGSAHIVS